MFIDATISYSARAFSMLTRGLVAQHAHHELKGLPANLIGDLGVGHQAIAPVIRGTRYR